MRNLLIALLFCTVPAFATDYQPLVRATLDKVVTIQVRGIGRPEPTLAELLTSQIPEERPMGFLGSGSVVSSDGIILTCDHLFTHKLTDRVITVKLANGQVHKAFILAEDQEKDLATLKIFPLHRLPYFKLGAPVHRGQAVVSFGSPLGLEKTVSFGHIENVNVSDKERPRTLHGASINPGNSGGPLVDVNGYLVGVNIESYSRMEALHLAVTLRDIREFLGE